MVTEILTPGSSVVASQSPAHISISKSQALLAPSPGPGMCLMETPKILLWLSVSLPASSTRQMAPRGWDMQLIYPHPCT